VAVPACWAYNYFSDLLRIFEVEAANASLEVISYLARLPGAKRRNG
jgi:hypothetical protein